MVDLSFLRTFTKDDPVKMKRYISLYLNVAPKTFEEMQRNLINKDWEQLRINAHSLKPQAEFMGILTLKDTLIQIEEAVKSGNLEGIEHLFEKALIISTHSDILLHEAVNQL